MTDHTHMVWLDAAEERLSFLATFWMADRLLGDLEPWQLSEPLTPRWNRNFMATLFDGCASSVPEETGLGSAARRDFTGFCESLLGKTVRVLRHALKRRIVETQQILADLILRHTREVCSGGQFSTVELEGLLGAVTSDRVSGGDRIAALNSLMLSFLGIRQTIMRPHSEDEPILGDKGTAPPYSHAPDFTSMYWFGAHYTFRKGQQAKAVEILFREWQQGHHLSEVKIGEMIRSESSRFRLAHLFRDRSGPHPAWGTMIQRVSRGVYVLRPPAPVRSTKITKE